MYYDAPHGYGQASSWPATTIDLDRRGRSASEGDPFYKRLNHILDDARFDAFVEEACTKFYTPVMGRPGLPPGRYFRLLLVGYFEGIDSERGIAWRATDSLVVRSFLRLAPDEAPPYHSTISRTRRLIDHDRTMELIKSRLQEAGPTSLPPPPRGPQTGPG
jgi:hypothetical protein